MPPEQRVPEGKVEQAKRAAPGLAKALNKARDDELRKRLESDELAERRQVRLTKTSALFGRMAKGSTFVVKAREGMDSDEARAFAYKVLKREHIDENPLEWQANEEPHHA